MRGFSDFCVVKIAVMKVKRSYYESPETVVVPVRTEGFICMSNYMQFGSGNASGSIDDNDIFDGGSF